MLCVTSLQLGMENVWLWGARQVSFTWNRHEKSHKGLRIHFPVNFYWVPIICQKLRPRSWEHQTTETNEFCSGGTYSQWWHQVLLKLPSRKCVWNNMPSQLHLVGHFPPCSPAQLLFFFKASHVLPQAWQVFKLICVYQDEHQHHVDNHWHPEVLQDLPPPLIVHLWVRQWTTNEEKAR